MIHEKTKENAQDRETTNRLNKRWPYRILVIRLSYRKLQLIQ